MHLYKPIPATRTAEGGQANFVFELKSAPTSPITVDILDSTGAVVDTSRVTGHAGVNEASWNLLYPPPDRVVLRSIPPDDPHIWEEGRFQNRCVQKAHAGKLPAISDKLPATSCQLPVASRSAGLQACLASEE